MTRPAAPALIALTLLLGACGNQPDAAAPERKTAAGDVLGGSISDAMLPLDTVQSQSPPLREAPAGEEETRGDAESPKKAPAPEQVRGDSGV